MNEAEWLACTDPTRMVEFLQGSMRASERKFRLFACALVRDYMRFMHPDNQGLRNGLEVSERYADGLVSRDEWWNATRPRYHFGPWKFEPAHQEALWAIVTAESVAGWHQTKEFNAVQAAAYQQREADLLRCVFGLLPFRKVQ